MHISTPHPTSSTDPTAMLSGARLLLAKALYPNKNLRFRKWWCLSCIICVQTVLTSPAASAYKEALFWVNAIIGTAVIADEMN